jgi:hypothetical protein
MGVSFKLMGLKRIPEDLRIEFETAMNELDKIADSIFQDILKLDSKEILSSLTPEDINEKKIRLKRAIILWQPHDIENTEQVKFKNFDDVKFEQNTMEEIVLNFLKHMFRYKVKYASLDSFIAFISKNPRTQIFSLFDCCRERVKKGTNNEEDSESDDVNQEKCLQVEDDNKG